jgi:ATP-dependent Lon protease
MNPERSERIEIPVLPLRDVVVYPHMVIPLFVGREKSIRCLEAAMDHDKKIMLVAQKEASTDEPGVNDLFSVGTVASILQMLKLPDGTVKVLVEGLQRARITTLSDSGEHFAAQAEYLESPAVDEREQEVLVRTAINQFEGYIKLNKKIPPEVLTSLNSIEDAARLADTIAAHMPLKLADKQSVLEMFDITERLEYLMAMMESEIDLLQVEKRIRNRVKKQMEKSQREYYLNEQMKAIQKELGEMDDTPDEHEALKRKIEAAKMPKEAREKTEAELQKLKMMSPMSAEATVVRGYIDWMLQVPWNARSKVKKDLRKAQEVLDTDHFGLERVKDRILEYLAVQTRVSKIKGPILCLVGPPGLSGYTEDEKLNIAKQHLLPKQLERNALKKNELTVDDSAIIGIIRFYTREAGVRSLERELSKLCRKAVKQLLMDKDLKHIEINGDNLKDFLGVQKVDYGRADTENRVGQVTGLAWTEVGGELLTIETACVPGKGKLTYTGSLGEVMQESIQAALTVVRSRADKLGINPDFYEKRDIHVHVPEGATPKDGPSAGIAMCTALVSCLTGNPVRADVAMTGEITLRGLVLPIGGLKEKLLAAHRGGIKVVLIPDDNKRDLEEIPANVLADLEIHPVKRIDDVLNIALQNPAYGALPVAAK